MGRRALVGICVLASIGIGVTAAYRLASEPLKRQLSIPTPPPKPSCVIVTASGRLRLDPSQAENAGTIAAVGKRMGLEDGAVTVAFAAALQESKLRNLPYGDLDSLGLFQQRPSQGWGTSAEVMDPAHAASAFFSALARVPGWATMPIGDAAQRVQRSAGPDAYHLWEGQARTLTEAFTGETGAALTCRFDAPAAPPSTTPLDTVATAELGGPVFDVPLAEARGWTVASWVVGHSYELGVTAVTFNGQRWTPSSGRWDATAPPEPVVRAEH